MNDAQGRMRVLLDKYADKMATEAEVNELYNLINTKDENEIQTLLAGMMQTTEVIIKS
jgi:hypothetical protein